VVHNLGRLICSLPQVEEISEIVLRPLAPALM